MRGLKPAMDKLITTPVVRQTAAAAFVSAALIGLPLAASGQTETPASDISAVEAPGTAKLPALVDVTTRDKTIASLIDSGPPSLADGETASSDTAYSAFQRGWHLTALALATPLAENGDRSAQALLGVLHEAGLGIKQDKAKAADWYGLAAAQGDNGSALQLAQLYLLGDAIPQDKAKAAELFEQAAEADNPSALYNLAILYKEGEGRPYNEEKARELLEEAAQLNDPEAQYTLALAYLESGDGLNDPGKGAFWMGRAARRGHTFAQVYYGILRFQGRGVDPDESEAADWFERAATAGNPVAMNRLARIYAYGRGREHDNAAAAGWHLIARTLGVSDPTLDGIFGTLDDETLAAARKLAEQYSATLMAPSDESYLNSP
ncbi:tetratricopeptide repeat protein [Roseibium sp. MB-4]